LIGVEAIAHFGIDGGDKAQKQGVEVFAGGKAGGNRGFWQEVEDEAMGHG
jgi:hypothetical protein